ncbi:MAG TPA: M20/M25/M40 family metallo-hydrolase [Caulobacteraceae bacterium]|nr:M20/M25/M40 family metallo-hydrolase [Caulobacteraceae bacterium]
MRAWVMGLGLLALSALPAFADPPPSDGLRAGAEAVRDHALKDHTAYDYIESLSVDVGPRLAGSEATPRATAWAVAKLTALGFSNVHTEPFQITAWLRGPEEAEVVAPHPQKLAIIGLGGSAPTPPDGIEGEIVVFHTYADLLAAPVGSLTGKIAVVTQPMPRAQDGSGYGALNAARRQGPSEAARRGAAAYLVRSLATGISREPHTGALNYQDGAPKIPAAALSTIDAELIDHLAARGQPIRIRLKLASTTQPATVWTVEGEFRGTEHPDQIIQLGGHLDSWDPGMGSIDDGAGMAIAVAAARLAASQNPPKRTIRVALFGAEEMDFTRAAFAAAHMAEKDRIVIIGESDVGSDRAWKVSLPAGSRDAPAMKLYANVIAPLSVMVSPDPSRGSGDDTVNLVQAGVPAFSVSQDASRYFDWHHSSEDTLDKVDPDQLAQAVATWAAFAYIAANSDIDFRALAPSPALTPVQSKP